MKNTKYILLYFLLILLSTSCEDLEVENLNDPDAEKAMSNPSDVKGVAAGLFNVWYMGNYDYYYSDSPALALWVMADAGTCSWGNWGMRDLSSEPRASFDNTSTYGSATINSDYYASIYSSLSQANDVLELTVNGGMVIEITEGTDDTPLVNAVSYFVQGLSLGSLGLLYDQAFIVTEETDLSAEVGLSSYSEIITASIASIDKCIAICESNEFTIPATWFSTSGTMSQDDLKALASSFAARFLSMSPRNAADNALVDWQAVYDYASDGITSDFAPIADDTSWWNYYQAYANYSGWGRTDMRIVHMMDSRMPATWPDGGFDDLPDPITVKTEGIDNRILTNFEYMDSNDFYTSRGEYHFSCYRFAGRDEYLDTWTEPCPEFMKVENDLYMAEAALHLSKLPEAAEIINNGSRVTEGGLASIASTEEEIEDAIFHERMVELFNTALGLEFFTMRKDNLLQEGTMLHFPIPGEQLDVIGLDYYTFGGTTGVAGEDYSNGGWK